MKDALVAFVQTGKLSFASLVDAILAGLARMAIRQAILAPFLNALGLGLSPPALTGTVPPAPVSPNLASSTAEASSGRPGASPAPVSPHRDAAHRLQRYHRPGAIPDRRSPGTRHEDPDPQGWS